MKHPSPPHPVRPAWAIAQQSLRCLLQDRTVALLALLFVVLVMLSAYLGWSATHTINQIYNDAVSYFRAQGQPIPPNPVQELSSLGLMRNLSIYVSLIGALAAIVIGYELVATDRKAAVLPLLGSRPLPPRAYALGKITALLSATGLLSVVAAVIVLATFLALPQVHLSATEWGKLFLFLGLAYGYLVLFGLLAMGIAAQAESESVGLLLPVTLWLTLTFIFPSLTANIHPTSAINPISALALPPDSAFFHGTRAFIGSLSLADDFKYLAAGLLDYRPAGVPAPGGVPPLPGLMLALGLVTGYAVSALNAMNRSPRGCHA
jgi:ABC-type transport system involved in multi-copper enzyme maturation permease subunit